MKVLLIVLLLLTSWSCQKYKCSGFDKGHSINKWNWFPENQGFYKYVNKNQEELELTRTKYEISESREFWCHMCACGQELTSHYDSYNVGIQFRCTLGYWGDENNTNNDKGSLYYGIDKIGSPFSSNEETVSENEVPQYEYREFEILFKDTVEIADTKFANVTELSVLDTTKTKIRKLWIAPSSGLIGFRVNNQDWRKR
jgi:hypothetical protein